MLTLNTKQSFAVLIVGLLFSAGVNAEDDPHWNKDTCQVCHVDAAPVAGDIKLHEVDAEAMCDTCHGDRGDALQCRHVSDIPGSIHKMPASYRDSLKDGQLVCSTCHDLNYQCQNPNKSYSFMNPGFLRDRVSRESGNQCFECHDSAGYEKLNPHDGVTGLPPRPTCLLCHENLPESDEVGGLKLHFNMQDDLNDMCLGCHKVRPHPGNAFSGKPVGWEHLAVPSADVLENIRNSEEQTGVDLPLSPLNGEIFCGTCHDQHGFQSSERARGGQPAPKHRLRTNNICQACHDK